jgi:hypothetical protein
MNLKMKFKLPEIDLSQYTRLYCGDESRLATATAIAYVDPNKVLVTSLLGKRMYLIDISNNKFKIINEKHTGVYSDLIDFRAGKIISANALSPEHPNGTISLFDLVNDEIIFIKEFFFKQKLRIHGCRFLDDSKIIVASNDKTDSGLYFVDLESESYFNYIKFQLKVKDVHISNDRLLVIASKTGPTKNGQYVEQQSLLYLYKLSNMEKLDEIEFQGQADAICFSDTIGLVTVQGKHSVFYFELINDRLIYKKYISGFNFPHGIAIMNGQVLVTNYGDNSIDVLDLTILDSAKNV